VPLVDDDEVVQTLTPQGADQALVQESRNCFNVAAPGESRAFGDYQPAIRYCKAKESQALLAAHGCQSGRVRTGQLTEAQRIT
jgi:hypothetical protein